MRTKSHRTQYLLGLVTFSVKPGTPPPMRSFSMKVKYDGVWTPAKGRRPGRDERSSEVSKFVETMHNKRNSVPACSTKCTRCIFTECRRNRSPRPSACFCYRLHAAWSSSRHNVRSHGHRSAFCRTGDCFRQESICGIDLGSRCPPKGPLFAHFFGAFQMPPGTPPQPP